MKIKRFFCIIIAGICFFSTTFFSGNASAVQRVENRASGEKISINQYVDVIKKDITWNKWTTIKRSPNNAGGDTVKIDYLADMYGSGRIVIFKIIEHMAFKKDIEYVFALKEGGSNTIILHKDGNNFTVKAEFFDFGASGKVQLKVSLFNYH